MAKTSKDYKEKDVIFLYNKTDDILSVEKKTKTSKVKGSIDIGDVILDISNKGTVIGIELLKASKNVGLSKDILSKIEKIHFNVKEGREFLLVRLVMLFGKKEVIHTTHVPMTREALMT